MKLTLGSFLAGHRIVKCIWEDPSGGAIYAAYEKSEREEKDNIASCKVLSSLLGWTCVLLPPRHVMNVKTADMMKADDLTIWEIKTNYSGNPKTISRALQDAKRQAENAVIRIVATECDMKAIHKAAKLRKEYSKLENIIIICDGTVVFV